MNGGLFVVAYMLAGLGISITTVPKGRRVSLFARVAMVPGWLVFFAVAALILAMRRGRDL